MNTYTLKCPNCDGNLEVEDGLDTFFCKYCGRKIFLDGQSDAAYQAKTRIIGMEHDERMADKKYEHERYKIEQKNKHEHSKMKIGIIIAVACVVGYIIIFEGFFGSEEKKSIKQEEELQQLVDEIMVDIENEDFDTAYIKAQSIDYTENWSSDIDKKWDNTRKEVINQIIEAEKKQLGNQVINQKKTDGLLDGSIKIFRYPYLFFRTHCGAGWSTNLKR